MSPGNLHILLVDDHAESLFVLARLLEKAGHAVHAACDFAGAMKAASQRRFDLLISDVGLPDRSGLELMQELHALQGIRGIALSGFTEEHDARASTSAGFARHLNKPVAFAELTAAIKEVVGWCPSEGLRSDVGWQATR